MQQTIYGINPVLEILRSNPQKIHTIFLPAGELTGRKKLIHSLARQHNVKIQRVPIHKFETLAGAVVHQGVIAEIAAGEYQDLEALLEAWEASREKALFVALDGIEDPHNFGAIIRTAHVVGAHGVIVPKHRSAPLTSAAAKASAGASALTPICRVPNLVSTLQVLKEKGIWIVGTAEHAPQSLYDIDLTPDLAVVIGSEGKGMRDLIKRNCDFLVSIPTRGGIQSLNASVAAGVVLFEVLRQRRVKGRA